MNVLYGNGFRDSKYQMIKQKTKGGKEVHCSIRYRNE